MSVYIEGDRLDENTPLLVPFSEIIIQPAVLTQDSPRKYLSRYEPKFTTD